jgi:hypothetical protein
MTQAALHIVSSSSLEIPKHKPGECLAEVLWSVHLDIGKKFLNI